MDNETSNEKKLTGKHVLLMLFVFFGVMLAVNFYFVYIAISSFPGEDVDNPYTQGLKYNETIASRDAQSELGWSAQIGLRGASGARELLIHIEDADGFGISYLTLHAELRRTISDKEDMELDLKLLGRGDYGAPIGSMSPGKWEVRLEAYKQGEEDPVFQAHKILDVK